MEIIDVFFKEGFSKEDASKLVHFWLDQKENPFVKTDIKNRLNELFSFFSDIAISKAQARKMIAQEPRLFFAKTDTLRGNAKQYEILFDTPLKSLSGAFIKQPSLLYRDPATIILNVLKCSRMIGVSSSEFIKKGLKSPVLFSLSPETLCTHLVSLRKNLSLKKTEFAKIFKKFPNILTRNPQSILKLIEGVSTELSVPVDAVKKSFLKAPSLFNYSIENLISKVDKGAKTLGLEKTEMARVFLSAPMLFEVRSGTVEENVSQVAKIFDVEPRQIVHSFLKLPTLFLCSPVSIKEKYDFYKQMYLEDVFSFRNEEKKDLNLLKEYLLKDPRETLVNGMQSLALRKAYGLWLKEKHGFSSMAPVWKRTSKILADLRGESPESLQKYPLLSQKLLESQKGK